MKNTTTTRCRYRSKTVVAFAVASLALSGVPLFGQTPDVVVQWNNAALQGVRDSKIGPPMVARALFMVHNCIYDAWAAYDNYNSTHAPAPSKFSRSLIHSHVHTPSLSLLFQGAL
jgi:hypothetical protein